MEITRYILPVIVGAISGILLISGGELLLHHFYLLAQGTDETNRESLANALKLMPVSAYWLLLGNYIFASFFAGLIATLTAKRTTVRPAIVVGIVLTLAGLYNVIYLPQQPLWFIILNMLVYLPLAYFGYLVVRKRTTVVPVS